MFERTVTNNDSFQLPPNVVGRGGTLRVASKVGSDFKGQTLALQVQGPSGNWYDTGVSFKESGAQVLNVRDGMTYRFAAGDFTNVALGFWFF